MASVVSVVNALSTTLKLRIWRGGIEHEMEFAHGDAVYPLRVVGPAPDKRGTEVTFLPLAADLHDDRVRLQELEHRLRELAFLNSGVRIILTDARQRRGESARS